MTDRADVSVPNGRIEEVLERWHGAVRADGSAEVASTLPAPEGLQAASGQGHVTLTWDPVDGATCYLVERAPAQGGPWEALRRAEHDLVEVPVTVALDTSERALVSWYRVAALREVGEEPGDRSVPTAARVGDGSGIVEVRVDASRRVGALERVWWMIGSERPAQLLCRDDGFGHDVREEVLEAYRRAAALGVTHVRAHSWLDDDFGLFDEQGRFAAPELLDEVTDAILATGLRPVVELSFMPRLFASGEATVFTYRANVTPPRNLERYAGAVGALVRHLVARYGIAEVRTWAFEVWNEPNLSVFWTGDRAGYFTLYDRIARVVKEVDASLRVGGPATAGSGWIGAFLDFVAERGSPIDFVSTHTYGGEPLDLRPLLARVGLGDRPVWWTEWGVSPTHHASVNDGAFGAPFVLRGLKAAQGAQGAVAYWVVSDHFEELGRPNRLAAGGFGLLTVGNLPKARFHALQLAAELPSEQVALEVRGDGAVSLVDAWAAREEDRLDVLLWNGSRDAHDADGRADLDRIVRLEVVGLDPGVWVLELVRIDDGHGSFLAAVGEEAWPSGEELERVRRAAELVPEPLGEIDVRAGEPVVLSVRLAMPGVARVRARRARG